VWSETVCSARPTSSSSTTCGTKARTAVARRYPYRVSVEARELFRRHKACGSSNDVRPSPLETYKGAGWGEARKPYPWGTLVL
jgi:hypothetical protein